MAILQFGEGMEGLAHALAFEQSFRDRGYGRETWNPKQKKSQMYAWMLKEEDVKRGLESQQWPLTLKKYFSKATNKEAKTLEGVSLRVLVSCSDEHTYNPS